MRAYKRKVTEKRLAANRAAAAQSTGPRTEDGKRRSAFNSFQHGLYATQDPMIRQAFARSGLDPAQYDHLHQHLAASFDPQDAMQALLVEDLTRLYWLKNISQRAMAEWQAREAESFHFQCAKRRLKARRFEPVIEESLVLDGRWLWVESCPEKFEKLDELLETLDSLARTADWNNAEPSDSSVADGKDEDDESGRGAARRALPADDETRDQNEEDEIANEDDQDDSDNEDNPDEDEQGDDEAG